MRASTSAGAPVEWIEAMTGRPLKPRRLLIAGCGVGTEAFALAAQYPGAEVVGVDFSPRAIDEARRLQRKSPDRKRLRFEVADLARRDLPAVAGDDFDLVSCHGVLSYIPDAASALRNMARCMARGGVMLLGVNGAGHISHRYRTVLRAFGIDPDEFREGAGVRDVLRVCDTLSVFPPVQVAGYDAGYLAGDVFGPLNHSLPLTEWTALLRKARLSLASSFRSFYVTRDLVNRGLHPTLMPRTRAEISEIADVLHPTSFHQLLVVRNEDADTRFPRAAELMNRTPAVTTLYKIRKPRATGRWNELRGVRLRSPAISTSVDLEIPEWEVEILRKADGSRKLLDILAGVRVAPSEVREALYLLYLLGALNP